MRGLLLPLSLLLAAAATLVLLLVVARRERPETTAATGERPPVEFASPLPADDREPGLRRYQTTTTLAEDLRDALGSGDRSALDEECWRVARSLKGNERWMLVNLAPEEASPRVRALIVFCAGVHIPDSELLLGFLTDRAGMVRRAAVLASIYEPYGERRLDLLGVAVPVGRGPAERTSERLERLRNSERDAGVEEALAAAARLSPRR